MKIYTFYIDDDRYSVPALDAVTVSEDRLAQAAARARLAGSSHYRGIEIWDDDRLVAKVERDGDVAGPVSAVKPFPA